MGQAKKLAIKIAKQMMKRKKRGKRKNSKTDR